MTKKATTESTKMTSIRTGTCKTLSQKSELKYSVGVNPSKAVCICVTSNDGGGFFSPEWIAWKDIEAAIKEAEPVTSSCLKPAFKGKSVNSSGFLLAVLVAEGILEALPKKTRHFEATGKSLASSKSSPRKAPAKKKTR
ncbi:MAG: hypothetical protein ACJAVI_003165 [Candidatus Azotimanducaceae bacterium]|jgi:hypothetical protein